MSKPATMRETRERDYRQYGNIEIVDANGNVKMTRSFYDRATRYEAIERMASWAASNNYDVATIK